MQNIPDLIELEHIRQSDVRNGRQLIQDGEWITIDGIRGIIEF